MNSTHTDRVTMRWGSRAMGRRRWLIGFLLLLFCATLALLDVTALRLPDRGGLRLIGRVLSASLSPALSHVTDHSAITKASLWGTASYASWKTLVFAVAAISLACPTGLVLACWYSVLKQGRAKGFFSSTLNHTCRFAIKCGSIGSRSVHEVFWAVILLSMVGLTPLTAVLAIAIPYTGIFIKVFGDILDETPQAQSDALALAGASPASALLLGRVAMAKPMLIAYTLYRFECGLRSAAVLGFFGVTTLGYHIRLAFDNAHYHEMWTYLYALMALVLASEYLSTLIRKALR